MHSTIWAAPPLLAAFAFPAVASAFRVPPPATVGAIVRSASTPLRSIAAVPSADDGGDGVAGADSGGGGEAPLTVAERCYEAWNRRDMDGASSCFLDDGLEYDDAQFLGTIRSRRDLRRRFELGAAALPRDAVVIADEVASCEATGNVGARWHLERKGDGSTIPGTSGCSFYTTDPSTGLIRTGFKATEMVFKPDKTFADRVVASASTFTGGSATGPRAASSPSPSPAKPEGRAPSIIETYYEAWNRRDLESALDCVSDDCVYETEDPLFVSVLRGKDELRSHLEKNAASLPPSARIVLDDLAIDGANGNIGARWHLEVNGFAVPNLRGCSMYATDAETGLLKGGYDVTEAPVKIPGPALGLLAVPSMLGLIR